MISKKDYRSKKTAMLYHVDNYRKNYSTVQVLN